MDEEQRYVFIETLDALLYYVNDRLGVVKEFSLEEPSAAAEVKIALVTAELWAHVEIIDQFIRENPYQLPARHLAVAESWKCALGGTFTLVRYQAGRALLMGPAGVFSVCGVAYELDEEMGPAPAEVDITLLPFEDLVVYDGFIQAYDVPADPAYHLQIQNEFEERCAQGIVATGAQFVERARAYLQAEREKDFDDLLASLAADADMLLGGEGGSAGAYGEAGEAGEGAAGAAAATGASGAAGAAGEGAPASVPAPGFHRGALAGLDPLQRQAAIRANEAEGPARAYEQALTCAEAAATLYGVASLESVFGQFQALCGPVLSAEDFVNFLRSEASYGDQAFSFWEDQGVLYLVHYTLGEGYVAWDYARRRAVAAEAQAQAEQTGRTEQPSAAPQTPEELDEEIYNGLLLELGQVEAVKRGILGARADLPMKPLTRRIFENNLRLDLMDHPSVAALRSFLDAHVPDGEDDFSFADAVVDEVVRSAIEVGSRQDALVYLGQLGMDRCGADAARLPALVDNLFANMPSWEANGWSSNELYEQMTGKKIFYNAEGMPMRVGRDEPCPCGSGKKYRDCHGF